MSLAKAGWFPALAVRPGIPNLNGVIRDRRHHRAQQSPRRLDSNRQIEQPFTIVRSGKLDCRFLQPRFEVFLRALLKVKADDVPAVLPAKRAGSGRRRNPPPPCQPTRAASFMQHDSLLRHFARE